MSLQNLCCRCCYPKMKYDSGFSSPWMQDVELIKREWCVFAKSKQDTNLTRLFTVSPHMQIASMTNGKKKSIHEKNKKSDTNRWRTNSTIVPFVWVLYLSKKDSKNKGEKLVTICLPVRESFWYVCLSPRQREQTSWKYTAANCCGREV
jgi:hypothetical protein